MTIEFHCPYCQKLLKTADDKAGARANCPGCGEQITVPDAAHEAAEFEAPLETTREPDSSYESAAAGHELVDTEAATDTKTCPMCGEQIKRAARRCRFCGENLASPTERAHQEIEAGEVLNAAWDKYKAQFGLVFGGSLILIGVEIGMNVIAQLVQAALQLPNAIQAGRGGGPIAAGGVDAAQLGIAFTFGIISFLVQTYLQAGYHRLLLKVMRGEPAEVTEVFSGGRYFWRIMGASVLFFLAAFAGLLLLVIPYFIVLLALWPFQYAIVDRDCGVIDSFRFSHEATRGNYLACILIALAAFGVQILGLLACCIGTLFTTPLTFLFFAAAYCGMTGQLLTRRE